MVFIVILVCLFLSLLLIPAVKILSVRLDALDLPNPRKVHNGAIPRLGGVAIFFSSFLPIGVYIFLFDSKLTWLLVALVLVFITGLIDDIIRIGFKRKTLGLLLASCIVIYIGDIHLKSLGNLFALGDIYLGYFSIPFTFFAIVGVTNAINLIDGLDGLAGGIGVIALLCLSFLSYLGGAPSLTILSLALLGSLIGFLIYNRYPASVFMGDSGSLYLGFSLAVISVILTQNPHQILKPVIPVIILAVPIFDTLWVMGKRIMRGENPFMADKMHIHHCLMELGMSHKKVVYLLWGATSFVSLFAILFRDLPSYMLFYSTLGCCFAYRGAVEYLLWKKTKGVTMSSRTSILQTVQDLDLNPKILDSIDQLAPSLLTHQYRQEAEVEDQQIRERKINVS